MSKKSTKSDLARLDRMKDADIDYSDIPPLDKSFYTKAREPWPPAKQQLTIRLDADVLKWLKGHGRGYQTRINRILRAAMDSQPPRRLRSVPPPKKNGRSRVGVVAKSTPPRRSRRLAKLLKEPSIFERGSAK